MAYTFTNQKSATLKYYPSGDISRKAELTIDGVNALPGQVDADTTVRAMTKLLAIGGATAEYTATNALRTVNQRITQGA